MNKPVFHTALICSLVGFGAGIAVQRHYTQPTLEALPLSMAVGDSANCVSTLRLLRAGNTDGAIRILETRLDGALVRLSILYPPASATARAETHAGAALRQAQEYRRANPHQSDARYAGAVAKALALPTKSD